MTNKKAAARLGRQIRKATGLPFPLAMSLGKKLVQHAGQKAGVQSAVSLTWAPPELLRRLEEAGGKIETVLRMPRGSEAWTEVLGLHGPKGTWK